MRAGEARFLLLPGMGLQMFVELLQLGWEERSASGAQKDSIWTCESIIETSIIGA